MHRHPLAAVVPAPGEPFRLEHCDLDAPQRDELLVRVLACGLCATDLKAASGLYGTPLPAILGHETVAEVLETGSESSRFRVGDRILVSYGFCGSCDACCDGPPIYCHHSFTFNVLGRRLDGSAPMRWHGDDVTSHFFAQSGLATETIVRECCAIPVPKDIQPELLAPLACGALTGGGIVLNLLKPPPGGVIVAGCGTVGLTVIALAVARGHKPVVAIDRNPDRLAAAARAGADEVVGSPLLDQPEHLMDAVPPQPNVVDTTGAATVIELLQRFVAPRGQLILAGIGDRVADIDLRRLVLGGRTVRGTAEGEASPHRLVPELLKAIRAGTLPIDDWVHTCPFTEISRAVDDLAAGRVIKPVIRMPSSEDEATW